MKLKDFITLFSLAALWGASFLFIKIASPVLGPVLTIEARVIIAGVVLLIYLVATHKKLDLKSRWKQYLILGIFNAAIPFTFIAMAALYLNASLSAILNSLTPLFTALVAWGWMKEKMTLKKIFGFLMGIIGVLILVGWSPISFTSEVIISVILSILATVSYGFAGVYSKKAFEGVSPLSLATGQQLGAAVALLPFTLFHLPRSLVSVSPIVIFSVIGLAIFCTSIAYLLYFYLISSIGPTPTLTVTLLVPLFGMIWGSVFLNEHISISMIIGLLTILSSVLLISNIQVPSSRRMGKNVAKRMR
ncbi:DMT family transporter [Paenibacillus sediminis]|uniref:Drug/metabolite transporter (DMT)-like permease n=1 Tax=Paenibacillus sediminis TaxID=664909 RepID=A0ABS4H3C7_9BACL|nr:DMT family transporter [Paenibacillus sediminis]MBP1937024.1 drug/metabolite transporter (DMT)-like permease [Paenibacillus sediminis]